MQQEDPFGLLFEAMAVGDPRAIENQERRGQGQVVNSSVLPKRSYNKREEFEAIGIVYGEDADDLFVNVTLPDGWTKQPTDHSLYTDLVDEKGRKRASIMYKAAFYDRDASVSLLRRFSLSVDPVEGWLNYQRKTSSWHCVVKDSDTIIWQSEKQVGPEPEDRSLYQAWDNEKESLYALGQTWLHENYPNWGDTAAYWED